MRGFFISLGLSFILWGHLSPLSGQVRPDTDWGQNRLRTEFHESLVKGEIESFQRRHEFSDIAERYWIERFQNGETLPEFPNEISSGLQHWRAQISNEPWNVVAWGESLLRSFALGADRPIELVLALLHHGAQFLLPLLLCLSLLLILHLLKWAPSLRRDLDRSFRSKGELVIPILFALLILWGVMFKSWALIVLIGLLVASVYSRRRSLFLSLSFFFCFGISFGPALRAVYYSLEDAQVIEVMHEGRNRLEYSKKAIGHLPLDHQALWAYWNGDFVTTRELLKEAPASALSASLQINLDHSPMKRRESADLYLRALEQYPNEPIISFNLAQLFGGMQDLASSDRYRSKVPSQEYSGYLDELQRNGRTLLTPAPKSSLRHFWDRLRASLSETYSFEEGFPYLSCLLLLYPWLLFGLFFWLRHRASGLCRVTGEATSSVYIDLTPLAERMTFKSDDVTSVQRQTYLQKRRAYEQLKYNRILVSSWFFAPSYDLFEGKYVRAFVIAFVIFSLFTLSLPFDWRAQVLQATGSPIPGVFGAFGFSLFLFLLSGGLHYWIGLRSRRKADE